MKTVAVFLDMSKALDTIDHNILFNKLEKSGVHGLALDWFKSYMSNRQLCVEYSKTVLALFKVEYRSAQGSVLGPIMYNFFTNDLQKQIRYCQCISFTDDTNIFIRGSSLRFLKQKIKLDLNMLTTYFKQH